MLQFLISIYRISVMACIDWHCHLENTFVRELSTRILCESIMLRPNWFASCIGAEIDIHTLAWQNTSVGVFVSNQQKIRRHFHNFHPLLFLFLTLTLKE